MSIIAELESKFALLDCKLKAKRTLVGDRFDTNVQILEANMGDSSCDVHENKINALRLELIENINLELVENMKELDRFKENELREGLLFPFDFKLLLLKEKILILRKRAKVLKKSRFSNLFKLTSNFRFQYNAKISGLMHPLLSFESREFRFDMTEAGNVNPICQYDDSFQNPFSKPKFITFLPNTRAVFVVKDILTYEHTMYLFDTETLAIIKIIQMCNVSGRRNQDDMNMKRNDKHLVVHYRSTQGLSSLSASCSRISVFNFNIEMIADVCLDVPFYSYDLTLFQNEIFIQQNALYHPLDDVGDNCNLYIYSYFKSKLEKIELEAPEEHSLTECYIVHVNLNNIYFVRFNRPLYSYITNILIVDRHDQREKANVLFLNSMTTECCHFVFDQYSNLYTFNKSVGADRKSGFINIYNEFGSLIRQLSTLDYSRNFYFSVLRVPRDSVNISASRFKKIWKYVVFDASINGQYYNYFFE